MDPMIKNYFSPMLICWNDIKIHLGFEDSYLVPPPTIRAPDGANKLGLRAFHIYFIYESQVEQG